MTLQGQKSKDDVKGNILVCVGGWVGVQCLRRGLGNERGTDTVCGQVVSHANRTRVFPLLLLIKTIGLSLDACWIEF